MKALLGYTTLFGSFTTIGLVITAVITALITFILYKTKIIKQIQSISGIGIIIVIAYLVFVVLKSVYLIYQPQINKALANRNYFFADLVDDYKDHRIEKQIEKQPAPLVAPKNDKRDDGVLDTALPPNREASRMQYSEADIRNSLDKIVEDFGFEAIFYLQRVVLNARQLEGSSNVIYMKLEDYAFICSMNICNKYLYDFNALKDSVQRQGYFLVLVIPEFVAVLNNYTNLREVQ
jgi:hypothetical protein